MKRLEEAGDHLVVEQVVRIGELYSLREAMARLGWGRDAFDSARKQGLKTIKKLGRVYVSGRAVIEFLDPPESQP